MRKLMTLFLITLSISSAVFANDKPKSQKTLSQVCVASPFVDKKQFQGEYRQFICSCLDSKFTKVLLKQSLKVQQEMYKTALEYYQKEYKPQDFNKDRYDTINTLYDISAECIKLRF